MRMMSSPSIPMIISASCSVILSLNPARGYLRRKTWCICACGWLFPSSVLDEGAFNRILFNDAIICGVKSKYFRYADIVDLTVNAATVAPIPITIGKTIVLLPNMSAISLFCFTFCHTKCSQIVPSILVSICTPENSHNSGYIRPSRAWGFAPLLRRRADRTSRASHGPWCTNTNWCLLLRSVAKCGSGATMRTSVTDHSTWTVDLFSFIDGPQ